MAAKTIMKRIAIAALSAVILQGVTPLDSLNVYASENTAGIPVTSSWQCPLHTGHGFPISIGVSGSYSGMITDWIT